MSEFPELQQESAAACENRDIGDRILKIRVLQKMDFLNMERIKL